MRELTNVLNPGVRDVARRTPIATQLQAGNPLQAAGALQHTVLDAAHAQVLVNQFGNPMNVLLGRVAHWMVLTIVYRQHESGRRTLRSIRVAQPPHNVPRLAVQCTLQQPPSLPTSYPC